jgi:hypothetical protein
LALGLAGLTLVATGCSLASPTSTDTPYTPSDGTNADLNIPGSGAVKFRNFLLVTQGKGKPGVLVGSISTNATKPVDIQVAVLSADGSSPIGQATVTAKPDQLVQLGSDGSSTVQVSDVPLPPGSLLKISAHTVGGNADFDLPVIAQQNQYASITASETSAPASSSASESPSPTASSSS